MLTKVMTELERLATERILKTRTETILTNRFYGVLVSNVEPVLSRNFPTAATNGKQHFFNPEFVEKLTDPKWMQFTQRHESEHDARHHSTRRSGRDPKKWNIACDHAINIDLIDEGMVPPPEEILGGKVYADPKYRGMSAEDIYRCLELDEQRAEQEKPKGQPGPCDDPGDSGKGDLDDEDVNSDTGEEGEEADDADEPSDENRGSAPEQDDSKDESETGESAGEGDDDRSIHADDDESSAGNAEDEKGSADGTDDQGAGDEELDDNASGTKGNGNGEGEGEATGNGGEPSTVTGAVPGGLGEVLDAAGDPAQASQEEAKWERVIRQAAAIGRGDTPGHARREIDRANQPKQDWREVLRAYFDQGAERRETWNRPNRRFIGSGIILPGSEREGLNTVVFLVDTSGSVDDKALDCVHAEMQAALDERIIDKLIVVHGDIQVTKTAEYLPGDEIDTDAPGRGGTYMKPLFQWAAENVDNPSLIVCFTDLYIEPESELGEQPACTTLWAVHGYPDRVREHLTRTPWGEPGIDVGAH